jgi:hypothetical protein
MPVIIWQRRFFWLQFDKWQAPPKDQGALPWIDGLPAFVPSRQAYYRGACRVIWKAMRNLLGTNRPAEPAPTDSLAMRQALDAAAKWCEAYSPTVNSAPRDPSKRRATLLPPVCLPPGLRLRRWPDRPPRNS